MTPSISGIHHVTAIAGPPQPNVDFYAGFLGLRFVKKTVNFDDPGTYHFYYGDDAGRPGSIMTFFPWPDGMRGKAGAGQTYATAFAVPDGSLDYWVGRFADHAVDFETPVERFGRRVLGFKDPDGLHLELIEHTAEIARQPDASAWTGPVPPLQAIRGFEGVTLWEVDLDATARLLTDVFRYQSAGEEGNRLRFAAPGSGLGRIIDLQIPPSAIRGRMGSGTIHHVAFRARDEEEQLAWREEVSTFGLEVTPVLDRQYFKSIYFREPGGVLFEIATDPPGFTRDESFDELGSHLKLPPWLEPRRAGIEQRLPEIRVPYTHSSTSHS